MQNKSEVATELFADGKFNCSTSVFTAFCEEYGVDLTVARRLACGLGGGCRAGEICGAVSGGVMVVGLKHGQNRPGDTAARERCYAKTQEFTKAFLDKKSTLTCKGLLGADVSTDEGRAFMQANRHICVAAVQTAAEVLEEQGY
ncbi:MAG: C-GCAxxG-C-C family protein [Oscillospiraceae bacterium]|nr:C-GCAxxG-C-C family protein [Oscillospiraceae bacterium]